VVIVIRTFGLPLTVARPFAFKCLREFRGFKCDDAVDEVDRIWFERIAELKENLPMAPAGQRSAVLKMGQDLPVQPGCPGAKHASMTTVLD
jgi:hypothetical protein